MFRASRVAPRWVRDLEAIDRVLREHAAVTEELVAIVTDVLAGHDLRPLSEEQWLRALLVQQASRYGDDEMGFQLNDSQACRSFCRLVSTVVPEETIRTPLRRLDDAAWNTIEASLRRYAGDSWRRQYHDRVPG